MQELYPPLSSKQCHALAALEGEMEEDKVNKHSNANAVSKAPWGPGPRGLEIIFSCRLAEHAKLFPHEYPGPHTRQGLTNLSLSETHWKWHPRYFELAAVCAKLCLCLVAVAILEAFATLSF